MPTDCSAGPSAPAPPNSSEAPRQQHRVPAREDDQRHRGDALAAGQALVPAAGIVERQERAADAGEKAADHGRAQADEVRPSSPWRARHRRCRRRCARSGPSACCASAQTRMRRERDADEEQHVDRAARRAPAECRSTSRDRSTADAAPSAGSAACRDRRRARCRTASSAMPTAMSLTRGKPQITACSAPSSAPATPAASTPSHGEPVR